VFAAHGAAQAAPKKIRVAPIDDGVVLDEQRTIDLYFRSGLINQRPNAGDIVDPSFSAAIEKSEGL
jgi:sulfonate transport system substrate-binding protein